MSQRAYKETWGRRWEETWLQVIVEVVFLHRDGGLQIAEAGVWNSSGSPSSWQKRKDSFPALAHLLPSEGLLLLAECLCQSSTHIIPPWHAKYLSSTTENFVPTLSFLSVRNIQEDKECRDNGQAVPLSHICTHSAI